jgi:serine/threonine protein kinase
MNDNLLGRLIDGRFQLEKRLGEGGMGAVFEAIDTKLNKKVAVKVLQDRYAGNADMAERFIREAKAAGALSANAHICEVTEYGKDPHSGPSLYPSTTVHAD